MATECFLIQQDAHSGGWVRKETGQIEAGPRRFGPGAVWYADWMSGDVPHNGDGHYVCVILPNGREWSIDSQSNNCNRPGEDHDCWCRHGELPRITVDKIPNEGRSTCSAGAGSIQSGEWHGFLREGLLLGVEEAAL